MSPLAFTIWHQSELSNNKFDETILDVVWLLLKLIMYSKKKFRAYVNNAIWPEFNFINISKTKLIKKKSNYQQYLKETSLSNSPLDFLDINKMISIIMFNRTTNDFVSGIQNLNKRLRFSVLSNIVTD